MTVTTHQTESTADLAAGTRTGRLNVKINEDTARAMSRLMRSGDVNATEVVRRAVALLDLIESERADDKAVELVAKDDSRERLRFMY